MKDLRDLQSPKEVNETESRWTRTIDAIYRTLGTGNWDGSEGEDTRGLNRQIVVAAFIVVGLIGVIGWFSAADQKNLEKIALLQDIQVANRTDEIVSVWVRRDAEAPLRPGSSIASLRPIECAPPQCGIRPGKTDFWAISRESDAEEPPFAVTAWLAATGEVLYAEQFSLNEMDRARWLIWITDQR